MLRVPIPPRPTLIWRPPMPMLLPQLPTWPLPTKSTAAVTATSTMGGIVSLLPADCITANVGSGTYGVAACRLD
jgi:hypothetical protein